MTRFDWAARAAVTVGALLPYLPLLRLNRLYVTDDGFTSDIFNGELPIRVLTGQMLAEGQAPVWTSGLCSGMPLAAGNALEPLSLTLFATQPTARALCLVVIALILVAGHGAFTLARRFGADRSGAVLAGIAFAGSGYIVTQLKHLGIVSTVVWLPWGILMLDRAMASRSITPIGERDSVATQPSTWQRLRDLAVFGLIYAEQVASGFPQSAYISGLVYGVVSLSLLARLKGNVGRVPLALLLFGLFALASLLALACGAPTLLPLVELARLSDRHGTMSWEFASMLPYSWIDLWNFLLPYRNGDIADMTYRGKGLFWENYGYVGLATVVLAFWTIIRGWRRPRVWLLVGLGVGALAMVLGRQTPLYLLAWKYLPGMGNFRFPTRFLIVVELMLAILGALGLGLLRVDLVRLLSRVAPRNGLLSRVAPRIAGLLSHFIVLGTGVDLFANQTHQNPYVPATEWLTAPAATTSLGGLAQGARFYAPLHSYLHRIAYQKARGWADLNPYRELRETVAPNTGVFFGVATADCYMGIAPKWYVDTWGDHSRGGLLVPSLIYLAPDSIVTHAALSRVLASYGVTHLLSTLEVRGSPMREIPAGGAVHLYEIPGRRARVVPHALPVKGASEVVSIMKRPDFDPDRQVFLHDVPTPLASEVQPEVNSHSGGGTARVVEERPTRLRLAVSAPRGGYLLLTDTYYPGWHATIDGNEVPIHRANISVRAVKLPPGARSVEFVYEAAPFFRGLTLACGALGLLLLWLGASQYRIRSAL